MFSYNTNRGKIMARTKLEMKDEWIKETQMFQRIAKVNESTYEELALDWDSWNNKQRISNLDHIKTHRTIQRIARGE